MSQTEWLPQLVAQLRSAQQQPKKYLRTRAGVLVEKPMLVSPWTEAYNTMCLLRPAKAEGCGRIRSVTDADAALRAWGYTSADWPADAYRSMQDLLDNERQLERTKPS